MKQFNKLSALVLIVFTLSIAACKSEKDTRFNRFIQTFTSRFNAYFHAQDKLNSSVNTLAETHEDDFTEVLEVYPYGNETTGASIQPAMDEVYKKASWVITERPLSKWVDDSYFLIGKSQFFKREYYTAIETFQYVASKYKGDPIAYRAQIWIAKSQIQQEKYNEAEALLSLIRSTDGLPQELMGELSATTGWVYIREKKYGSAIQPMKEALYASKDRQQKIRFRYILAQLYLIDNQYKEANAMFTKVIKMNPPYEFAFNAKISLAKAVNKNDKGGLKSAKTYLTRMLKDDKNISYFDQIYYELGNIEKYSNNVSGALQNYEQSAKYAGSNVNQKVKTYLALANTYFELPDYEKAQAYYDSTADVVDETHPDFDNIITKRDVLSDLIENLVTLNTNDSLINLSKMPKEELEAFLAEKAKNEAEENERKRLEEEANKAFDQNNQLDPNNQQQLPTNQVNSSGQWYFYNPSARASGFNDFKRKWGDRPLVDNWRVEDKVKAALVGEVDTTGQNEPGGDDYNPEDPTSIKKFYMAGIPRDTAEINAMHDENKEALRNIGSIYQNSLSDYPEAIDAYNQLLNRYPKSKYEPEVLYNLYKIYDELGNKEKAEEYKNKLLTKYPSSDYSKIITKSTADLLEQTEDKEIVNFYENTYRLFSNGDYNGVLSNCKIAALKYPGNALQPKFDYLKAMAVGKTKSIEEFKKELTYIINSYPNTDISEQAQTTLDAINKGQSGGGAQEEGEEGEEGEEKKEELYKFNPDEKHYYINFIDVGVSIASLQSGLVDYNNQYHSLDALQITNLLISQSKQIIFVKEFANKQAAEKYKKELVNKPDFFTTHKITNFTQVTISASNFKKLLADKDVNKYLAFYSKYYNTK